jgi:single-strand DNA-binding protein
MYQSLTIVGNVGKDAEMRYLQNGTPVTDFTVAVNRAWTDKQTNEAREETTWFRISAWNKLAETCNAYIKKGMSVLVVGSVSASAYVGKEGEARASLEVRADTVKFLSRKDDADSTPADTPHDIPF